MAKTVTSGMPSLATRSALERTRPGSVASKAIVATSAPYRIRRSCAMAWSASSCRAASRTRSPSAAYSPASRSATAEVAPTMRTVRTTSRLPQPEPPRQARLEEARRVEAIQLLRPGAPRRVHRVHHLGREPRVLGQVDAPSRRRDQVVEAAEEAQERLAARGDVHGEGVALGRERHGGRVAPAEALDDAEERAVAAGRQAFDDGLHDARGGPRGHDELVLVETAPPVEQV